ncbi:MAG TPA: hypothetical protein VF980_19450 [Thermoanaerobaculia bacterium]
MTITCGNFDDLLLEGDTFAMQLAAQHARTCDACAEKFAAWNDISDTAQSLHTEWQTDMLWPRIQRELAVEKRKRFTAAAWRIAAAIILTIGLGGGAWFAVQRSRDAAFDRAILRASALDEVERAEQAHIAAINHLEQVANEKLERSKSPLMVSYKEKLMLLDDAIAECQTNIDRNRQNANLRKQLLAVYSEKQRTLEEVMREGTHASNQ